MIYKINRFIFASKWSGNARTALFSATNDLYYKPVYQPQIKTKMEERKLTEKESLEVITSMIARTKQRLAKGVGDIMLMWGYLVVCVTLLVWGLLLITKNPAVNWCPSWHSHRPRTGSPPGPGAGRSISCTPAAAAARSRAGPSVPARRR